MRKQMSRKHHGMRPMLRESIVILTASHAQKATNARPDKTQNISLTHWFVVGSRRILNNGKKKYKKPDSVKHERIWMYVTEAETMIIDITQNTKVMYTCDCQFYQHTVCVSRFRTARAFSFTLCFVRFHQMKLSFLHRRAPVRKKENTV